MNTSKSFSADKLFGIAAFIIGIGTFGVYIYEASLMRTQQYASVLPYLELGSSNPGNGDYKLILANNGLGPAFVREIRVRYKAKTYEGDHAHFHYTVIQPKDTVFNIGYTNVQPGRLIPAGQMIELIIVQGNPASGAKASSLYGSQEARLEIVYASVYDEKWKITGMAPPQKLE